MNALEQSRRNGDVSRSDTCSGYEGVLGHVDDTSIEVWARSGFDETSRAYQEGKM